MFRSALRPRAAAPATVSPAWVRLLTAKLSFFRTLAVHGLVAWLYLWFATDGSFRLDYADQGPQAGQGHYNLLADAFLAGQLHLKVAPAPELLALPDPYDPNQNAEYRVHDASLYNGRWYLYWGPVPGLIYALWQGLTGRPADPGLMQLVFGLGGCLWFWLLARGLRDQAFRSVPDGPVLLVYLGYALSGANLFLQAQVGVYHEAILAGTCFTLAGCYFLLRGLAGGRFAEWRLALAGVLFGCGFGSRMTMVGFALGAGSVLAWRWVRAGRRWPTSRPMLAFGLPSATILALLLLYNHARFDSFTEFGTTYQLLPHKLAQTFDLRVAPANVFAYLLYLPRLHPHLPFLQSGDPSQLPRPGKEAGWILEQPMVSLLVLAPLALLAPLAVVALASGRHRGTPAVGAFVVAVGIGVLFALGTMATWTYVAERYIQDVTPIACLLGGLVLWRLHPDRQARRWQRWAYAGLGATLLATSLAAGLSYGMLNVVGRSPAYLAVAYRFDSATGSLVRHVTPEAWPASYLADAVRQRRGGIFYPDGSVLTLDAPRTVPIRGLEVELLPSAITRIAVEIDGKLVGEEPVGPGEQVVPLPDIAVPAANGQMAVRLAVTDQPAPVDGFLWPIKLGRLVRYRSEQERVRVLEELRNVLEQRGQALRDVEREVADQRLRVRDQGRENERRAAELAQARAALGRAQEQGRGDRADEAASSNRAAEVDRHRADADRARVEADRARTELDRAQADYDRGLRARRGAQREVADLEADIALNAPR